MSTAAVFDRHLGAFAQGLDAVLADYDAAAVVITPDAVHHGIEEIRQFFAGFLAEATPEFWAAFRVETRQVAGEVAYLVWSAAPFVTRATDTLLVRDDRILVQTFTPFHG
ncbi:nuclear transport factor 2 family protein (plasmid) [Tistrella mobilis]|jgi:ketosteroid isomerase-like protein|uniref:SnoaL-like domain-containing protein n=1 Tax=Tistrella mobilis TaxID=171437 RepID=A0A162LRH1_9PROT|nr:nuclear transport factor 2 family protein [Tistrella mobilis]KYO56455.1 hypothetical protein AUP44_22070 [Tistrella mobilis]